MLQSKTSPALEEKYELTLENEQHYCRVTTSRTLSHVTGYGTPNINVPFKGITNVVLQDKQFYLSSYESTPTPLNTAEAKRPRRADTDRQVGNW